MAGDGGQAPGLRQASAQDLDAINAVIERAVMTWGLPARVKRLSIPLYRYSPTDLEHLELVVAEIDGAVCGVAAWERAEPAATPQGAPGLLLHGLYVDPVRQRRGVGTALLNAAAAAARAQELDGVLVKAQRDAMEFFAHAGLKRLPVGDDERDYAYRLWLPVR